MKRSTGIAVSFALTVSAAGAQPLVLSVPLERAKFEWSHPDPTTVVEWVFECNGATAARIPRTETPSLEVPLTRVITEPGEYSCRLRAANEFGTSAPSDTVTFKAGHPPAGPTAIRIVVP